MIDVTATVRAVLEDEGIRHPEPQHWLGWVQRAIEVGYAVGYTNGYRDGAVMERAITIAEDRSN